MDIETEKKIREKTLAIGFAINHISYLVSDEDMEKFRKEADSISDNVLWFVNKLNGVANES